MHTHVKGVVFAVSDQSQNTVYGRNPAEQQFYQGGADRLFFKNTENSNISSRSKATPFPQQKPRRNAGRKFERLYTVNSWDNTNSTLITQFGFIMAHFCCYV